MATDSSIYFLSISQLSRNSRFLIICISIIVFSFLMLGEEKIEELKKKITRISFHLCRIECSTDARVSMCSLIYICIIVDDKVLNWKKKLVNFFNGDPVPRKSKSSIDYADSTMETVIAIIRLRQMESKADTRHGVCTLGDKNICTRCTSTWRALDAS